jgi:ParB family chromosome partitioning protein
MKYVMKVIPFSQIVVGDRFREDLGNIEELAASIREKGLIQPISVNSDFVLLAGGRRYNACKALGLEKIPVVIREGNDEVDAREVELMENIHRKEMGWQEKAKLVARIHTLYTERDPNWMGKKTAQLIDQSEMNVSRALRLAAGLEVFPALGECKTADEAHKVIKKAEEEAIVEELAKRQKSMLDKVPEVSVDAAGKPTPRGIDQLVKNTILAGERDYHIGDVFQGLRGQKKETFSFIECDPPYGVDLDILTQREDMTGTAERDANYNEIKAEDYPNFLNNLVGELYRVAKPNSWMIFWFAFKWQQEVKAQLQGVGWVLDEVPAIWSKPSGRTPRPDILLARCYEPFYICKKGQPTLFKQGRSNLIDFSPDLGPEGTASKDKYHPAQRPVRLMRHIMGIFLDQQVHKVLIPFAGSGATFRACYQMGYLPTGYDNNDRYKKHFLLALEQDVRTLSEGTKEKE